MKTFVPLLLVVTIAFSASVQAANDKLKTPNTFIDFDTLTPGDQLTDQYQDLGVTFEGTFEGNLTAGLVGTDGDAGHQSFGNSPPNFVIVGSGVLTMYFDAPVSDLSFRLGDGVPDTVALGVTAFDENDLVLDSHVVLQFEDAAVITFPYDGISKVRVFGITGCPNCTPGVGLDDLSYIR